MSAHPVKLIFLIQGESRFYKNIGLDPVASFSSLLQAAALFHQNKLRGASVKEALRFSCVDVFVKTRSSSDSKKQALLLLDEILDGFKVEGNECDFLPSPVTQSVCATVLFCDWCGRSISFQVVSIRDGSSLSRVKQEFSPVCASISAEDSDSEFLRQLCDLE